jgi:hypothetical protein
MPPQIFGGDLAGPLTDQLVASGTTVFGAPPAFWGRYFTSAQASGNVEYRHASENRVFRNNDIRVLPIARQTNHVLGTGAQGESDGKANAADIVGTFGEDYLLGQGGKFFLFLDVEGPPFSLSLEYYKGWVSGLEEGSGQVSILPCVYGIPADSRTWHVVSTAVAQGSDCHGLWLSRPIILHEPVAWDPSKVTLDIPGLTVPVLFWQYMFPQAGIVFDRDQSNPAIDAAADILPFLILPPGA